MKKVIFICLMTLFVFSGIAQASIDNTGMYGDFTGTLTDGYGPRSVNITLGNDPDQHYADGSDFYIYVAPSKDNWSTQWLDSDGDLNTFMASLHPVENAFSFTDSGPAWSTLGLITFAGDMMSFVLTGSSMGIDNSGTFYSSPVSGNWERSATPIPGAFWLLGSGLLGLVGLKRRSGQL